MNKDTKKLYALTAVITALPILALLLPFENITLVCLGFSLPSAVAVFFLVFAVMQIISVVLTHFVPFSIVLTADGLFYSTTSTMADPIGLSFGIAGTIFNVICGAGLFVATAKLMNSKVNIK